MLHALAPLRAHGGARRTVGLDDATLGRLASLPELGEAIATAAALHEEIRIEHAALLELPEAEQIRAVQRGYLSFYGEDAVNPYVALAASGPFVVTLKGAVVYDCGGYGILGLGHTPSGVLSAMARPQAMANVMTPSLSQLRFDRALRKEIGHTSSASCPYARFLCLNSGSEAVSLAARIADTNAKTMTEPGARHAGRTIKRLVMKGSFHGRTERPALYSDSSRAAYLKHLASFRDENSVITVPPHDLDALRRVFVQAEREGWFIEAMFLEPVMGEGDPGRALPPPFYAEARALTKAHGSLLLVDSIQAGLRAHGVLSVVDYPGFEGLEAPDLEVYSKALNAGQYPLSVLAVTEHAASIYRAGTYGNTMTTNPRALDVGTAVLEAMTPELRQNVRARGAEALERLEALRQRLGGAIVKVQGTGLLFSCELAPGLRVHGSGSVEERLRERGLGVIHGGERALRFTPRFAITSDELALMTELLEETLRTRRAAARLAQHTRRVPIAPTSSP